MPTIWVTPPEPPRWEALTVCPRCGGLYETWHPGGPDLAQLCTCMGRRRQPPWPRIDFDERWTLCACCAGVMIRSGSRWAELHCKDCMSQVQEHNARRGTPVPIGRHSAMHGVILGKDWGEVSELDRFADGMMSFHEALDQLGSWKAEAVRRTLGRLGLSDGDRILVAEYRTRLSAVGSFKDWQREQFLAMAARFDRRSR